MKFLITTVIAVFLCAASLAAQNRSQSKGPIPLTPPNTPSMQTTGKVGDTNYMWTNGHAWMALSDNAKVALVAGIEQGLILGVREDWEAVPKDARKDLVKTAARLTVGGFTFTQLAVQIDALYLQHANLGIPIVDAYEYALLELKKVPKKRRERFLERLRKTYHLPTPPKEKQH